MSVTMPTTMSRPSLMHPPMRTITMPMPPVMSTVMKISCSTVTSMLYVMSNTMMVAAILSFDEELKMMISMLKHFSKFSQAMTTMMSSSEVIIRPSVMRPQSMRTMPPVMSSGMAMSYVMPSTVKMAAVVSLAMMISQMKHFCKCA
ncbi:hypothetical protein CIPAW_01G116100 [Carya illinoinensis]|uniref:Uncharacterized protein n=1 Tax=Carya illinoinensis TaxID=32201 RepID=A0A8T1RLE6_CARIL|nr:hypothetical protein CIPAW_01G116100 [Carya illinoinensis]